MRAIAMLNRKFDAVQYESIRLQRMIQATNNHYAPGLMGHRERQNSLCGECFPSIMEEFNSRCKLTPH